MLKANPTEGRTKLVIPSILTRSKKISGSATITHVAEPVIASSTQKRKREELELSRSSSRSNGIVRSHSAPVIPLPRNFTVLAKAPISQQIGDDTLEEPKKAKVVSWRERTPTQEEAFKEMVRNSKKAIEEHKAQEGEASESVYAPFRKIEKTEPTSKISLACQLAERQGRRSSMEDASLFQKVEGGYLAGIFDGHGGSLVSTFASQIFTSTFSKARKKAAGDIHQALESTIEQVHKKAAANKDMKYIGSTVVASFIQENGTIYTATVGDSEAFIYEKDEGGALKSKPLSRVLNWASPGEANRATRLARTPAEAEKRKSWSEASDPKTLRVRNAKGLTLNLSRSIGDSTYGEVAKKPEITIAQVKPGAKIAFLCDGVTDFVSQEEVVGLIKSLSPEEDLAAKVADYALKNKHSKDNVTAMFLNVQAKT